MSRPSWLLRPWRALRRDIGRKFTALACALLLWGVLENLVVDERRVNLDVRVVATSEEADQKRAAGAAIYLVVPRGLILREVSRDRVGLHVKGLKEDVLNLNMSAVVAFDLANLGSQDEVELPVPLDRSSFKSRGEPPQFTSFRVTPETLHVRLAREDSAEITLDADNVATSGRPRDGYYFQHARITVRPNVVTLTGPRAAIERLRADPLQPRLAAVDIEGRLGTVTQLVGLPQELLDEGVSLLTPSGMVEVSIYIVAEDKVVEVLSVPVTYTNADLLELRKLRIARTTETLDLRVSGPKEELDKYTDAQLRDMIMLRYDWGHSSQVEERPNLTVYTSGLSDAVKVVDLATGEKPQIWYTLQPLTDPK